MLLKVIQGVYLVIAWPNMALSVLGVKFDPHVVPVFAFDPERNIGLLFTDCILLKFRNDALLQNVRSERLRFENTPREIAQSADAPPEIAHSADARPENAHSAADRPENAHPAADRPAD